jgi:sec-independent protein translocase protein TatA
MGLFDSPTHLLIILVVLVVLFGSAKLPKAAKSMGEAMRIFKKESAKLHEEDSSKTEVPASAPQQVAAPQPLVAPQQVAPQQASQEQMAALQQQMDALQQQMASAPPPTVPQPAPGTVSGTTLPETQHTNQSG